MEQHDEEHLSHGVHAGTNKIWQYCLCWCPTCFIIGERRCICPECVCQDSEPEADVLKEAS